MFLKKKEVWSNGSGRRPNVQIVTDKSVCIKRAINSATKYTYSTVHGGNHGRLLLNMQSQQGFGESLVETLINFKNLVFFKKVIIACIGKQYRIMMTKVAASLFG